MPEVVVTVEVNPSGKLSGSGSPMVFRIPSRMKNQGTEIRRPAQRMKMNSFKKVTIGLIRARRAKPEPNGKVEI